MNRTQGSPLRPGTKPHHRCRRFSLALGLGLFAALLLQSPMQADPAPPAVTVIESPVILEDTVLTGNLAKGEATFTLTANARVAGRQGATLDILAGRVALTQVAAHRHWRVRAVAGGFQIEFDRAGEFPVQLAFRAAVDTTDGWQQVNFDLTPGPLQRVVLRELPVDTQFNFPGAAQPQRIGPDFVSVLPVNGKVRLAWKESAIEGEGRLFYAAESLIQYTVSQGLLRQTAHFQFKVMQGELGQVTLDLQGEGEVTRVQGTPVLGWTVETDGAARRLIVNLNQPQRDTFDLVIEVQQPLGAFPLPLAPPQLQPRDATRFAGHLRIANEGAVRLEVLRADGLSQISPEQFPAHEGFRSLGLGTGTQSFVYRFASAGFSLRFQADNILPEVGVSQLLLYHLGETGLTIDAEFELDVREAPLRELGINLPHGYALARIEASGMSDHFLSDDTVAANRLRLVYGAPVIGRQIVQLRLERNVTLTDTNWPLPALAVDRAKSVRGHVGVSAEAGFRVTPALTQGLTDMATAFFPRKVTGLQTAFRVSDPAWQASVDIERLAQSIQVDAFHLFSVGERIAYGSSVLNYLVAGAPVSALRIALPGEFMNVEFTGREIRNWQPTDGGFIVQLHTPVAGTYSLLATYEQPFQPQGDTLSFHGAQPLDAQSEQGHTLIISAYPFQVRPINLSENLLPLEPGEIPAEYRLFFDAPALAAYRYSTRPFDLELSLEPLAQGDTLHQVVDRAQFHTRISADGQVATDARYFLKSKGAPWFRVAVPAGYQLWSASVNGAAAVPVAETNATLIPLPARADPNRVHIIDLKLAGLGGTPERLTVQPPTLAAPVLLAEWTLTPDAGHHLVFHQGTLRPLEPAADRSGFASLRNLLSEPNASLFVMRLGAAVLLLFLAMRIWRLTAAPDVYRFSTRHIVGTLLGLAAVAASLAILIQTAADMPRAAAVDRHDLRFLIPVQRADAAPVLEVALAELAAPWRTHWIAAWPALLGFALAVIAFTRPPGAARQLALVAAWTIFGWAALRLPDGATWLLVLIAAFAVFHVLLPSWLPLTRLARRPDAVPAPATVSIPTLLALGLACTTGSSTQPAEPPTTATYADAITHTVRVEAGQVHGTATVRWTAHRDQILPLLLEPAVLTRLAIPERTLEQVTVSVGERHAVGVRARSAGTFDLRLDYQVHSQTRGDETGFTLPTYPALVQSLTLTLIGIDADVLAPAAVSNQRDDQASPTNTAANLVFPPTPNLWLGWKPRSRDARREKSVFYAEVHQVYVPGAGVLEGLHQLFLRPAQGEITDVTCHLPSGFTVADATAPGLATWRFDPDTRRLRLTFASPQSRPFAATIRSQLTTGPLPYERDVGVIFVDGAAGQVGLLALATGAEVQLDDAAGEAFFPINLEDFPATTLKPLKAQYPGLTLRRAFRGTSRTQLLSLKAAPVEPDVRIESQQTLSLGEDRTILAANLSAEISRAGIFRLSFALPAGFVVEAISGTALSHWTELDSPQGRLITLHLKGKTEGHQTLAVTLAGPGLRRAQAWTLPRLSFQEASKQHGQLVVVPEQGMRLQITERDGVTQLDPTRSGIRQKGVLAFRLLQDPWRVALDIDQVDSWIQVTSLQQVQIREGQLRITASLHYEIQNTGVRALQIRLPVDAEGVRFQGEQLADPLAVDAAPSATHRQWDVKLHRRILGSYFLQVSYQVPLTPQATQVILAGIEAVDANLQRGFVTLRSDSRLQLTLPVLPPALQPADWQSIPRRLRTESLATGATHTFRLVDPAFALAIQLDRRDAVRLLPARVNRVTLTSVVADDGVMLTQARLELTPGDKRLLHLTLPPDARFWFAFVNQNGVWPWRDGEQLLIPLEPQARDPSVTTVDFLYTLPTAPARGGTLTLTAAGPKFDLPLENITWHLYLDRRWHVHRTKGALQFRDEQLVTTQTLDLHNYLEHETSLQADQIRAAGQLIEQANALLQQGDPQQARRAFQAAYGLSRHDDAFNEDARVQLHNLKLQQALIGLNNRMAIVAGDPDAPALQLAAPTAGALPSAPPNYTQDQARQILERNTSEETAVQRRLAERLLQQQDAAIPSPAAIRATVPETGRLLTFTRSLLIDPWADLDLQLTARAPAETPTLPNAVILASLFVLLLLLAFAARLRPRPRLTGADTKIG